MLPNNCNYLLIFECKIRFDTIIRLQLKLQSYMVLDLEINSKNLRVKSWREGVY